MKYKLIKPYPGSPKLGTILTHKELQYCNWNEYYEEVVEKDYEILSIKCKVKDFEGYILNKLHNGKFANEYKQIEFNSEFYDIHSVRRLSDGEIFTIGDFVNGRTISSFSINWMEIGFKVHCDDVGKGNINDGCFFKLQDLKKVKQPLFTTEDGVDIFEDDKVWFVWLDKNKDASHINSDSPTIVRNSEWLNRKEKIVFSTKEKADEYILMHKPCLSLKDIDELLCKNTSSYFLEKFKKLVQQKIK